MTYVPVVPPTGAQPPSPRTRELAGLLTKVLEEYKKSHPATTSGEIKEAVRLAQLSSAPGNQVLPVMLLAGIGALLAGIGVAFLFLRSGEGIQWSESMPMIIMALVVFLGIVLVLIKAASR